VSMAASGGTAGMAPGEVLLLNREEEEEEEEEEEDDLEDLELALADMAVEGNVGV